MLVKTERILKLITFFRQQDKVGERRQITAIQRIDGSFYFNDEQFDRPKLWLIAKIFKADLKFIYHAELIECKKIGFDLYEEMQKEPQFREMSRWIIPGEDFEEEIYV